MQAVKRNHQAAKRIYDAGGTPEKEVKEVAQQCITKLADEASTVLLASKYGKEYHAFSGNQNLSRPFQPALYIDNVSDFSKAWDTIIGAIDVERKIISQPALQINRVLYTAVTAHSCCYDLWKPESRKTPGTFFEILIGTTFSQVLSTYSRSKHIPIFQLVEKSEEQALEIDAPSAQHAYTKDELKSMYGSLNKAKAHFGVSAKNWEQLVNKLNLGKEEQSGSVATDIVFKKNQENKGLVVPAKITTRERIVQPFAHQRILDSLFGYGSYKSLLICVSEMQRNGRNNVNEICVPGTIRLFQKHLAPLSGIYYLDPPTRYLQQDITDNIPVGSVGELLSKRLPGLL